MFDDIGPFIMPPLTKAALALHEGLCNQPNPDINTSYAARVVQQEQIHQFFSQLGIHKGHGLEIGHASAEASHQGEGTNFTTTTISSSSSSSSFGGSETERSEARSYDDNNAKLHQRQNENCVSLSHSLKLFLPRQHAENHQEESGYPNMQDSTPLERFLTLDGCSDLPFISKVAGTQTGCYGHAESIDARQRQAQLLAEHVVLYAHAHGGSSPDSMGYM